MNALNLKIIYFLIILNKNLISIFILDKNVRWMDIFIYAMRENYSY